MDKDLHYNIYQDVITQLPFLNGYSHLVRVFTPPSDTPRDAIVADLQNAFDELRSQMPWLGHQVVTIGAAPGNSGYITSIPWPSSAAPNNVVREDRDAFYPPARSLLASGGSFLASGDLVPCPGVPEAHNLQLVPVMLLRLVFISGGVLFTFSAHHNMLDGSGLMRIWEYLGTLMNGHKICAEDIRMANFDRTRAVPLLPSKEAVKDYSHLWRPDPWPLPPPPSTEWRVFGISRSAVAELKRQAGSAAAAAAATATPRTDEMGQRRPLSAAPRVTSDDALTAFCWQRISAVRLQSGRLNAGEFSKFKRAANARGAMGMGAEYLGHMITHAVTRMPIERVVNSSLTELSVQLRRDMDEASSEWSVRSYVTFMAGVKDKSKLIYGGIADPRTDVGGTSLLPWALKAPLHMGILGECKLLRKPEGAQIPSCLYFLPSDNGAGDIQIFLCLTKEDLDGLCEDSQWRRYVGPVGKRVEGPKL